MRRLPFADLGYFPRLKSSLSFLAFVLMATFVQMLGAPGTVRAQEAGTWSGSVDQPGSSYGMVMELDGRGGGRTNYPSLSCSGSLSGGPGSYRETIVSNRATPGRDGGCVDGDISVSVSGDTMSVNWSVTWQGETFTASATLQRQGGGDAQACDVCGRALAADIGFGLSSSALLFTYVQQSLGKYANCARRTASGCANSCWNGNLVSPLPSCNHFDDNGFRACVDQIVQGASGNCQ